MFAEPFVVLLSFLSSALTLAQEPLRSVSQERTGQERAVWVDPGWRITKDRSNITFEASGKSVSTFEFQIKALEDKAVAALAQQSFPYNGHFDELTLSDLATVKSDGRVIPVDTRAIKDQPASTDTSSPYFDEKRVRIAAFPDVAAGDSIRGRVTASSKEPVLPGEFAASSSLSPTAPPEVRELTIDGPASKPAKIFMRGGEHREERVGDRILHHVTFRHESPRRLLDEVDGFDSGTRFEISTLKDYAVLAAALNARNAPMAVPDEALTKLSKEIVGDAADTRAKTERIHNWVARNIRYVGIGFEDGGLTSRPASEVLAARYGDCKAHATILKALLAAQGVEANFVAVNSGSRFTLTELATLNFDHAIAYIPALDLYLDPTSSLTAFGSLPPNLYGKPVLNVDKGTLSAIPVLKAEDFVVTAEQEVTMAADGTRKAKSTLYGKGVGATIGRSLALVLEHADRARIAREQLRDAKLEGSGDYVFPNPRELSDEFPISAPFEVTKPIDLRRGDHRLFQLPLTDLRSSVWSLAAENAPQRAFQCRSLRVQNIVVLTLPEGINAKERPAPFLHTADISGRTAYGPVSGKIQLSAQVTVEGRTVRSETKGQLVFSAAVCPAGFAEDLKSALRKMDERRPWVLLTSQPVTQVIERDEGYDQGLTAYKAKDFAKVLEEWAPLAERGNSQVQYLLGKMYAEGDGVPRDGQRAFALLSKSAEQGHATAQAYVGYLYRNGIGVAQDIDEAVRWYRKAAEQGEPYAQTRLGYMYQQGTGVPRDEQLAIEWYRKAADKGDAYAKSRLKALGATAP